MSKNDDYKPGNPEYDFWNDKNLYPSLRHDEDYCSTVDNNGDAKVGAGSVFLAVFVWLLIFAPFALFFTWKNWIVQLVFWGGMVIIILIFVMWICSAIEEEKQKKQ